MENTSVILELRAKLIGIDQIAVVAKCHAALNMTNDNRLGIAAVRIPAGRIPDMADNDLSLSKSRQILRMKNLMHKSPVLMITEHAVLVHRDSGCLLSSVLQSKQSVISQHRQILFLRRPHTEHTAFFSNFLHNRQILLSAATTAAQTRNIGKYNTQKLRLTSLLFKD